MTTEISRISVEAQPHPHFCHRNFLNPLLASGTLDWLEATDWSYRSIDNFYEVFDKDLRSGVLPQDVRELVEPNFIARIRTSMEEAFGEPLSLEADVTAQKMVTGQRIGIHSDYGPKNQACRMLVHLNRGWHVNNGGLFILFKEEFPQAIGDSDRLYLPEHNCAFGFKISPQSFHAVSRVSHGERYSLCYSFYRAQG